MELVRQLNREFLHCKADLKKRLRVQHKDKDTKNIRDMGDRIRRSKLCLFRVPENII